MRVLRYDVRSDFKIQPRMIPTVPVIDLKMLFEKTFVYNGSNIIVGYILRLCLSIISCYSFCF